PDVAQRLMQHLADAWH
ncbi:TPA: hypothetical protein JZH92_005260, partial [Escherichia coli O157]|nr:hypothetical protein [Escherichia coli O157]